MKVHLSLGAGLVALVAAAAPVEFFVSPAGDDSAAGTFEAPFATPGRASTAVRALKKAGPLPAGGVVVWLRGGTYPLRAAWTLGKVDSGAPGAPVAYRAWKDERPVLSGGWTVPMTAWRKADDPRIPGAARGKVWAADVKALGFDGLDPDAPCGFSIPNAQFRILSLYRNGRLLTLARHPDKGFLPITSVIDATNRIFTADLGNFTRWSPSAAPDLQALGYWKYLWADQTVPVSVDPAARTITIRLVDQWNFPKKDAPFYLQNALGALDAPGEWFLDRAKGVLYLRPPADEAPASATYELARAAHPLLSVRDGAHLRFEGIVFRTGRHHGVTMVGASDVAFEGCVVRDFGGTGFILYGANGCLFRGNVLHTFGHKAAEINGGDRRAFRSAGTRIVANDVSDTGHAMRTYSHGFAVGGYGLEIARNHMHDLPSSAFSVGGNEHLVASNLVVDVVLESDDQGGVDMWGDPTFRGNRFIHNIWRNIGGGGEYVRCGQAGIRFDDAISGNYVYGNRFDNCSRGHFGGVQIHAGRDNVIRNNLFTRCRYGVSFTEWSMTYWRAYFDRPATKGYIAAVDAHGAAFLAKYPEFATTVDTPMNDTVEFNIFVGGESLFKKKAAAAKVRGNVCLEKLPEDLASIPGFDPLPPEGAIGPGDDPLLARARAADAAATLVSGASATEIVRTMVPASDRCDGWKLNSGDMLDMADAGGGAVRFSYDPDRRGWGNMGVAVSIPDDAIGFSWKEKTLSAAPAARRHLWLCEKDGDMWLYALPRQESRTSNEWHEVTVAFDKMAYQPRGDKKRAIGTVNRLVMGFNFARQSVLIKDVEMITRKDGGSLPVRKASAAPDPAARIVVLQCTAEEPYVFKLLMEAGMRARLATSVDAADPGQLSYTNADLVVIPCSPFFPSAAIDNFKAFLKAGGKFFSFGGYAFDNIGESPEAFAGDPLLRVAGIADVNAERLGRQTLNSRFGRPGDRVAFARDVISIFDPSFLVLHDARTVASRCQTFLKPLSAFPLPPAKEPYFAAVAMTGSNDPVFPRVYARWIPVLEAQDRFGRSRGPVLSMVIPYGGPYASSAWAFCGHPELFKRPEPAADRLFLDICRRLLAPAVISTFKAEPHSVAAQKKVCLQAKAARLPRRARCRFRCGGRILGEREFAQGEIAEVTFTPDAKDADGRGIVTLAAEVVLDGKTVDVKETAVVLKKQVNGPSFEFKDNMFAIDGRRRFFGGMNTTGMMWFSDNEDPLVWGKDFGSMADYGMKFMRILHFSPFCTTNHPEQVKRDAKTLDVTPPDKTCRQTDAIVQISAASGVGIMLDLHDWIPWELEEDELDMQARWNRFWAGRYKDWGNVFYDIQNEPHPIRMKKTSGKPWTDIAARDGERKRAFYFERWQKRNADAVHEVNPQVAVTTGHLQTLDAVEKQLSTAGIDFSNVHHYGEVDDMRCVVKLTDRRFEGKGLSLGEFGARVSHTARVRGETGDPSALAIRHFLRVNHYLYGMGGAFSGVWDWKEFQDCIFPWGVTWQDGTPKPVLKAYRNMCLALGEAGAIKDAPALWLVMPDSFRIGGDSSKIHASIRNAADALLTLNVAFGVINEEGLARLPRSASALVWPMAVCPSDAAFADVAKFVKNGGALLVTGDFRYDADRKPTRLARLAELGMTADFPPLDPYATKLPETACVRTAGKTTWSPKCVELVVQELDEIHALYREFIDSVAKIPRLETPGAGPGDVIRFESALEDGGRCETAVNMSAGEVSFGQVKLAPNATFWRRHSPDGAVTVLTLAGEASGVKVSGAPCTVISLDGKDFARSRAIALLPYGVCEVTLPEGCVAVRKAGELGEFRNRRWAVLERGIRPAGGGRVLSVPDDSTSCDIRLFAEDDARDEAAKTLEKLL